MTENIKTEILIKDITNNIAILGYRINSLNNKNKSINIDAITKINKEYINLSFVQLNNKDNILYNTVLNSIRQLRFIIKE